MALLLALGAGLGLVGAESSRELRRRAYREIALETQTHTWRILAFAGGASECADAPYLTYRRDTLNRTISDHWYVALQLRADAALVRLGEDRFRCHVDKTMAWMERLWSPSHAGYAPRADLDGSHPTLRDVYADDNGLIGLAFLEASRVTADAAVRARALEHAERAAGFLLNSGVWDDAFGGGLWWNNQRAAWGEGKTALPTALMAQLMAELYAETGRVDYHEHALSALNWLDRTLWHDHHGLYAYAINVAATDPTRVVATQRYFGYDQAVVIQALLRLHRSDPNAGYLARAQQLGRTVDRVYWHPELGGYRLEADGTDIFAPYAAWIGEALLDLYAADGDPFWRDRAGANLDALHRTFQLTPGSYAMMTWPCRNAVILDCDSEQGWGLDRVIYTMTQAQIQRAAALQAAAY